MAVWKSVGDQLTWKAELDICVPLFVLCPLTIGLMVVWLKGFFWHSEYGFSSMGSCCYIRECVWN